MLFYVSKYDRRRDTCQKHLYKDVKPLSLFVLNMAVFLFSLQPLDEAFHGHNCNLITNKQ